MEEKDIVERALAFARSEKKRIARRLTNLKDFPADEMPVSTFMAGSPGAGKTESAKNLIQRLSQGESVLRIDPDDLRSEFEEYTGKNSSLFQGATSIIADKMQDLALAQQQSYVFDSTLTNLERPKENVKRNIKRKRSVFIVYVYQDPFQAWNFVKARETKDGRTIPKSVFIEQYFQARRNVNELKKEFGDAIQVDLIVKNIDGSNFKYHENINQIDNYITEQYTIHDLESDLLE